MNKKLEYSRKVMEYVIYRLSLLHSNIIIKYFNYCESCITISMNIPIAQKEACMDILKNCRIDSDLVKSMSFSGSYNFSEAQAVNNNYEKEKFIEMYVTLYIYYF